MEHIQLIGEDRLCCALGKKLINEVLGWPLASEPIDTQGITKLRASIGRYREVAKRFPVLCIADVDRGCAVRISDELRGTLPPAGFMLRLAVREAESWVLADGDRLAEFFGISPARVPLRPDDELDPKLSVLGLARHAKVGCLRREMISEFNANKPGSGYNFHLSKFVDTHWSPVRAAANSPSLARAVEKLEALKGE